MKIFISGSRTYEGNIPEVVLHKIDEHISKGDEFLIGDSKGIPQHIQKHLANLSYDKVIVYVSGGKTSRYNMGRWKEELCPVGTNSTKYSFYIEKDFIMAEDADFGIVVWDGESKAPFVNMVKLVFLGKTCDLYLLNEHRWIEIKTLDDLKDYAGECSAWGYSEIENILTKCGFSIEMKTHMMSKKCIENEDLIQVICTAPISLKEKKELLELLYSKRNIKDEIYQLVNSGAKDIVDFNQLKKEIRSLLDVKNIDSSWSYICNSISDIDRAIRFLKYGGTYGKCIFSLYAEWYDTDVFMEKSRNAGLFGDIDDVIFYIQNEEQENDSGEGWYRIEAWADYEGSLSLVYNFYTIKDEVCWFEKMTPYIDETGNTYYRYEEGYYGMKSLATCIGTPFKMGDVISVDCRPFGPSFHAIVLEDEHQYDSSFPTILFKAPYTDEWNVRSLKYGGFFKDTEAGTYWSPLSALFNVRLVEDEELLVLSEKLTGGDGMAIYKEICEKWHSIDTEYITTEEVHKIFRII